MSKDSSPDDGLPLAAKERIDRICVAFENAWKAGQRPRPEQYIEECSEAERSLLLRELQLLESYYRRAEGEAEHGRFLPGMLLANRYRVVGLLGQGGMGEVYRADDLKLGQPLALKFLPERLAGDSDVLKFFHNEVRLARQIAHPNVCRVYDIGEVGGQHFLSMEYVDGEDLASLLRRIGRLPPDKGIAIARQLAAGLAAAHDRGIVHRDLKPANVMLDGRGQVRIMDFGLACLSQTAGDQEFVAGTPPYMAPEQLAGEPVTVRSDLYSLGLVLYEMFTGQRPFGADSPTELASVRRKELPVPPSGIIEGLEPAVERVILRCLETDPQDRPPSASSLLAALPGVDTLSAALAAGETPSPEMVAAAGHGGGLRPAVGGLCLAGVLVGLLAVAFLSDRATTIGQTVLESPHSLAERAKKIIEGLGYEDPPGDSAYGFIYEDDRPQLAPVIFWYRQGPSVFVPQLFAGSFAAQGDGTVSPDDPPPMPGEVSVRLDPQGRLLELRVFPSSLDEAESSAAARNNSQAAFPPWSTDLFREAGLIGTDDAHSDIEKFSPLPVTWPAPLGCDSRKAWQGQYPNTETLVTVEAAVWAGRPVYFQVSPKDQEGQQQGQPGNPSAFRAYTKITVFLLMMIAGGLLARHNLRRGRGDRKGALRLTWYVLIVYAVYWVLHAGRAANPPAWSVFMMGMEMALSVALILWLFYVALEPYVRRLWPETMISWSRLLGGHYRDPQVGRDLLVGAMFGVFARLLWQIGILAPSWCGLGAVDLLGPQRAYVGVPLRLLMGGRYCLGEFFHCQSTAVGGGLCALLFLLLLRMVLRNQFLAGGAYILYGALVLTIGIGHPYISWFVGGLTSLLVVVLLIRFGLLAVVSFMFVRLLLTYPITTDLSATYAVSTTLLPLGVVVALASYGFYVSLAGRPLIRDAIV
ncbi:MAG: serine/threonine protein kinase [Pirellulaceae bacterium]|nr:serine/threonine protein kinase [Pirellulaceae bacterium]